MSDLMDISVEENAKEGLIDAKTSITTTHSVGTSIASTEKMMHDCGSHSILRDAKKNESCVPQGENSILIEKNPQRIQRDTTNNDLRSWSSDTPKLHSTVNTHRTEIPLQNDKKSSERVIPFAQTKQSILLENLRKKRKVMDATNVTTKDHSADSNDRSQFEDRAMIHLHSPSTPQSPAMKSTKLESISHPRSLAQVTFSTKSHTVNTSIGVLASPLKSNIIEQGPNEALHRMPYMIYQNKESGFPISEKNSERTHVPDTSSVKPMPSLFLGPSIDFQVKANHGTLNVSSSPAKTEKNEPQNHAIPKFTTNDIGKSNLTSTESEHDKNKKLRSKLVDTFAPYIHPTDNSLADARKRLRVALDQTRMLREAFSDRVYKKYRVVLRPVERTVDDIIGPIKTDPLSMKAEITRQIKAIKIEKEVEKKEAQKLNSEFAASHNPGETNYFMHGVENAEQLSWFCAGLNLVILPEEEVNITELEARGIQHRGPINPQSGARVGGISSAAATAANAMMDRVRKGAAMRVDRKIKYASEMSLNNSTDILNHTAEQPVFSSIIPSKLPLAVSNPSILGKESAHTITNVNRTVKPSQRVTNKKGSLQPKSGNQSKKQVKSKKAKISGFGVNLLSIMPNGEGLLANGKTPAAMFALISCGVGNNAPKKPSKAINGQRWRHPFPQSKAAKVISTAIAAHGQSAKRISLGSQAMKNIISTLPSETRKILLYPKSQNILKRRNLNLLPNDNHYRLDNKSATKKAVRSIIERFYCVRNFTSDSTPMKSTDEIDSNTKSLSQTSRRMSQRERKSGKRLMKRNVTEMGLLRDIRSPPAHCRPLTTRLDENNRPENKNEKENTMSSDCNEDKHRLAVSILYAIGLISNSPSHETITGNIKSAFIQSLERSASKQFDNNDKKEQIARKTSFDQSSPDGSIARPSFHVIDRLYTKPVTDSILLHETPEHDTNNYQQHATELISEKREDKRVAKSNTLNSYDKILSKNKSPSKPEIKNNEKSQIDPVNGIRSYYIPNLRGGGDSNMNVSESSLSTSSKKKEEIRKSSTNSNQPPIDSSQIDGSISSFPIPLSHGGSMINPPPNVNSLGGTSVLSPPISSPAAIQRQQIHNQFGHSNDLIQSTVLWGDQRNDISSLHSQTGGVSMLPPHITSSSLDGAYSIIAHAAARPNSNSHNSFSPTPSPSSTGLSITASTAARLQGQHQQHQPLSALHHSSNHANPEVTDFFTPNIHQLQQPSVSFGNTHHDWTTLGAAAGLLPAHSSLASTMGLTSHQAAMVSLTVRERAARAILAKQHRHHHQQHNSGVHARAQAAAHNVSVNRGSSSITNLSAQQASHFLGNSTGSAPTVPFKKSTHNMFQNISIQNSPPTPILSPSSTIPTLQSRHQQSTSKVVKNHKPSSQKKKQAIAIADSPVTIHNSELISENSKLSITKEMQTNTVPKKSSQNTARYEKKKSEIMPQDVSICSLDQGKVQGNAGFSTQNDKEKTKFLQLKLCARNMENQIGPPVGLAKSKEEKSAPKTIDQHLVDARKHDSQGERPKTNFKVNAHILKSQPDATSKKDLSLLKGSSIEHSGKLPMISTSGLQFFIPNPPSGISKSQAVFILKSEFYKAVQESTCSLESPDETQSSMNSKILSLLLDYLLTVGAAVPIPKAIIQNPIKEKFTSLPLKNSLSYLGNISFTFPREVVASCITIWLWAMHQSSFEKAFTKSGRIDVDPECKWLINAAIDAAMKALRPDHADLLYISETRSNKNPERLDLSHDQSFNFFNGPISCSNDITSIAVNMAYVVSKKLMRQFCIDTKVDSMICNLDNSMEYLDDLRMCSLRAKSQERALLAAFISRHVIVSDSFSNAYTSSMIRAGEALGYEDLCEIVQDESAFTSTLMPFDILSDSTGAWEDPCRPANGFIPGFSGDELTRKAHARALIQKSLKKIQDRYKIDGGIGHAGPYTDPEKGGGGQVENTTSIGTALSPKSSQSLNRSLSGLKRKPSFSGISDPTGLVQGKPSSAVSALFNPNHYSSPFIWDNDQIDNMPYGRYEIGNDTKIQVSDARLGSGSVKRQCRISPSKIDGFDKDSPTNKGIFRSTHEIEWTEIAGKFEIVSSTERSSQSRSSTSHHHSTPVPIGSKIFAPYCSLIDFSNLPSDSDLSDFEEDISDSAILDRHQKVLDGMKEKLDALMEVRQHYQDRSRRSSVR